MSIKYPGCEKLSATIKKLIKFFCLHVNVQLPDKTCSLRGTIPGEKNYIMIHIENICPFTKDISIITRFNDYKNSLWWRFQHPNNGSLIQYAILLNNSNGHLCAWLFFLSVSFFGIFGKGVENLLNKRSAPKNKYNDDPPFYHIIW